MLIRIFPFFLGTGTILAIQSECYSSLTKLESVSFFDLWFDCFHNLGMELSLLLLTSLVSELMLRWCIAIWGSSLGMSLEFQAKKSIYSRMSCISSSFSEGDTLLLMKIGLGLASSPRFTWVTLSSVGGSRCSKRVAQRVFKCLICESESN